MEDSIRIQGARVHNLKKAKKSPTFAHRNWFRTKEHLELVRFAIGRLVDIMSLVPGDALPLLRDR